MRTVLTQTLSVNIRRSEIGRTNNNVPLVTLRKDGEMAAASCTELPVRFGQPETRDAIGWGLAEWIASCGADTEPRLAAGGAWYGRQPADAKQLP